MSEGEKKIAAMFDFLRPSQPEWLKKPCAYCGKPGPHVQVFENNKYVKCLTSGATKQ